MKLSALLGVRCAFSPTNEVVGKVDDVIVRLRGGDLPLVTGLVAKVGGRRVYLSVNRSRAGEGKVLLAKPKVDLGDLSVARGRCCSGRTSWAPAHRRRRRGAGARLGHRAAADRRRPGVLVP